MGDGTVRLQAREPESVITIGAGTSFSNNVQVIAEKGVSIGRRCLIGDGVLIFDSDFHHLSAEGRHHLPAAVAAVVIEDNVFIGSRTIILKGVTIGKDSVIGAGSVVVRSIPPGVIAAGNPAKVIRPL
jgi:maltose O-acetyltransferase